MRSVARIGGAQALFFWGAENYFLPLWIGVAALLCWFGLQESALKTLASQVLALILLSVGYWWFEGPILVGVQMALWFIVPTFGMVWVLKTHKSFSRSFLLGWFCIGGAIMLAMCWGKFDPQMWQNDVLGEQGSEAFSQLAPLAPIVILMVWVWPSVWLIVMSLGVLLGLYWVTPSGHLRDLAKVSLQLQRFHLPRKVVILGAIVEGISSWGVPYAQAHYGVSQNQAYAVFALKVTFMCALSVQALNALTHLSQKALKWAALGGIAVTLFLNPKLGWGTLAVLGVLDIFLNFANRQTQMTECDPKG